MRASAHLALILAVGCNGVISDPGGTAFERRPPNDSPDPAQCGLDGLEVVSMGGLRRLSSEQYERTVQDLLGDASASTSVPEAEVGTTSLLTVEKLNTAAAQLTASTAGRAEALLPCPLDGSDDAGCIDRFIRELGRRAFRRPVTEPERQWLLRVYADAVAGGQSPLQAVDVVTNVVLQAPQLVYVREYGVADAGLPAGVFRLTDHERASRLSYFLWGTMPDDELLVAADEGRLSTAEGVREQARRMLADARAEKMVERFFSQWLGLDGSELTPTLEEAPKEADRFPEDSPSLRAAMRAELAAVTRRVFFEEDASLRTFLTADYTYVNGPLAAVYGIDGGPTADDDWQWVDLDPDERSGILTQPAFLALHAGPVAQSPVHRGVFVLEDVLCQEIGAPPPNANDNAPTGGASNQDGEVVHLSVREELSIRTAAAECAVCHEQINGIGFAFGNYDAIGRYRTEHVFTDEGGGEVRIAIDSSGALRTSDQAGPVRNAVELMSRLADSADAASCYSSRWVRGAFGGSTAAVPSCLIDAFAERYRETQDTRELILDIVSSNAFLHVRREIE